jgi:very-short-patch-repair endonuclease
MTPPEVLLWVRLRVRQADGPTFRRQHPMGPFILDFYCPVAKLAVEVDGFVHETEDHPERDERRDAWLEARGVQVLRIPASEVMRDPDSVADSVRRTAQAPSVAPRQLPRSAGEQKVDSSPAKRGRGTARSVVEGASLQKDRQPR